MSPTRDNFDQPQRECASSIAKRPGLRLFSAAFAGSALPTLQFKPRFVASLLIVGLISSSTTAPAAPSGVSSKTNESAGRIIEASLKKDEYFPPPHETQRKSRIEFARATP